MINAVKDNDGAARIAEAFNTAQIVIGMEFDHQACESRSPQRDAVFGKVRLFFKNPLDGSTYRSSEFRDLTWDHLVTISQGWGGRKAARVPAIRTAMKQFLDKANVAVERARAGFELPSRDEHERKIREWEEEERGAKKAEARGGREGGAGGDDRVHGADRLLGEGRDGYVEGGTGQVRHGDVMDGRRVRYWFSHDREKRNWRASPRSRGPEGLELQG
jgi:hypothetical protein